LQGFLISQPFLLEEKCPALNHWMGGAATKKPALPVVFKSTSGHSHL
jgi:hypothetical protein